jgi:deazaflavin-dependent oxidoreductase (nitroreductase family)
MRVLVMDVSSADRNMARAQPHEATSARPRFGGLLWRLSRLTKPLTLPLAGKRWNPILALVQHRGRRTGRAYATPVAAHRVAGGFLITLAFGAQVDWYRNLLAAGGGVIRWRAQEYPVSAPERIDVATGRAAFHPVERALLRICGVDGFVQVRDLDSGDR